MGKPLFAIIACSVLVSCSTNQAANTEASATEEQSFHIVTSDIDHFWQAYDKLAEATDSVAIFQEYYLDKASPEFQEFLRVRNFTADEYVQLVRQVPGFWRSVRPMTERIKTRKGELISFFQKMKDAYPAFKQPDVCFAIGALRTGGTTTPGLILIGAEIAAADSTIDVREFSDDNFIKNYLGTTGDIMGMVAHETIHTQQPGEGDGDNTLLKRALLEGAADFVASHISGLQTMNPTTFKYGTAHEASLWKEFYADVEAGKSFDQTDWFYKLPVDRPSDLGYFIGYKICEAYYMNAENKEKAIQEIIEMTDAKDFLQKSGYMVKFDS